MKFILTSQSSLTTSHWITQFNIKPASMKLAFIGTAAETYGETDPVWLAKERDELSKVGFDVTAYTLTGKTKGQLIIDLAPFDIIFVSGGNTFYLLEKAQASGFMELIKDNYFADKIYVGSSAGSVLLSHDIEVIKFLDDPTLAKHIDTKGIGLCNFVIFPHWGNPKFATPYLEAIEYSYTHGIPALLLADNQYLKLVDERLELVSIS